ncbi:MAG: hypothetical protein NVSMB39_3660 [Candidatus Saccharimonadales bacterium]
MDQNVPGFFLLQGEAAIGQIRHKVYIRMHRVPDRANPSVMIDDWGICFDAPVGLVGQRMMEPDLGKDLRNVRWVTAVWAFTAAAFFISGQIGFKGLLSQILFSGLFLGGRHLYQVINDRKNSQGL